MSDTVKLIVEMPKEMHEKIKDGYVPLGISKYLKNGTPLDDVKEEIDEQYDRVRPYNIDVAQGLEMALDILDNIGKKESEGE